MVQKCEAQAMAAAQFGDEVPPCGEPGTVNVVGWMLCAGCEDALKRIIDISNIVVRKHNEEN